MLSERWDLLLSLRPQTYSVQVHICKCLAARCSYMSGSLSDPLEVCDLKYAVFAHGWANLPISYGHFFVASKCHVTMDPHEVYIVTALTGWLTPQERAAPSHQPLPWAVTIKAVVKKTHILTCLILSLEMSQFPRIYDSSFCQLILCTYTLNWLVSFRHVQHASELVFQTGTLKQTVRCGHNNEMSAKFHGKKVHCLLSVVLWFMKHTKQLPDISLIISLAHSQKRAYFHIAK